MRFSDLLGWIAIESSIPKQFSLWSGHDRDRRYSRRSESDKAKNRSSEKALKRKMAQVKSGSSENRSSEKSLRRKIAQAKNR